MFLGHQGIGRLDDGAARSPPWFGSIPPYSI